MDEASGNSSSEARSSEVDSALKVFAWLDVWARRKRFLCPCETVVSSLTLVA